MSDAVQLKIAAATRALESVRSGMLLGLGTGSTSEEFVKLLGARIAAAELHSIRGVCTSTRTQTLAESLGIPILTIAEARVLDLAIDGADEVDAGLRLIKGRGAALLREKIVEQAAKRFTVIVDESKIVDRLGKGPLPVEVTEFARDLLFSRFDETRLHPSPRMASDQWVVTDEGNFIIDVLIPEDTDIAVIVDRLRAMAGVVETGFFPDEATEVIVAGAGGVRLMVREPSFGG